MSEPKRRLDSARTANNPPISDNPSSPRAVQTTMDNKLSGQFSAIRPQVRHLQTKVAAAMLDFAICAGSFLLAYLLRFVDEGSLSSGYLRQALIFTPLLAFSRVLINYVSGIYRVVWRYVGLEEALRFIQTVAIVSVVLLVARVAFSQSIIAVPFSIIIIEGALSFVGMAGARFVPRIIAEHRRPRERDPGERTILLGAGHGGLAIAREAFRDAKLGIRPVGFLDDDRTKAGMEIHGLRVRGTSQDVERVLQEANATQIIITSSAFAPKRILELVDTCRPLGVDVRIVSGLFELLDKQVSVANLREVRIEDLLPRDPVPPSLSLQDLGATFGGKRILVTGAGGSIGSELCRQLVRMNPSSLLLVERDETNLFEIERELTEHRIEDVCVPLLVDITDARDMERIFREYRPDVVFHAAAYKHVPMMERFPERAVHNNIFGTKRLVELADEYEVEQFVMISTDKAVRPTSVMGATKRVAELIVQNMASSSKTAFSCVRFGNVLASRGSVVGIFREQIQRGGPVTVTHRDATRYFMTIPEAANLVIQAATLGRDGDVFLLDMGEPVRILDLARLMIHLSGASEERVPIKIIGTRPGEKLYEELRTDEERIEKTELRKIFRCRPAAIDAQRIDDTVEQMQFLVRSADREGIRTALRELDIEYKQRAPTAPEQLA